MIPPKTIAHEIQQHHLNHDPIVLATPFIVLLFPLVIGIYITQHTKHKKRALEQRIALLERILSKTTDKEYS